MGLPALSRGAVGGGLVCLMLKPIGFLRDTDDVFGDKKDEDAAEDVVGDVALGRDGMEREEEDVGRRKVGASSSMAEELTV